MCQISSGTCTRNLCSEAEFFNFRICMKRKSIILILPVLLLVGSIVFLYARTELTTTKSRMISATTTPHIQASTATFIVAGTNYQIAIPAKTTVLNEMRTLASSTSFRFSSRDFPGMGAFVESINGKQNAGGKYWILYVNGVQSPKGISQTYISNGDRVEWKYESR